MTDETMLPVLDKDLLVTNNGTIVREPGKAVEVATDLLGHLSLVMVKLRMPGRSVGEITQLAERATEITHLLLSMLNPVPASVHLSFLSEVHKKGMGLRTTLTPEEMHLVYTKLMKAKTDGTDIDPDVAAAGHKLFPGIFFVDGHLLTSPMGLMFRPVTGTFEIWADALLKAIQSEIEIMVTNMMLEAGDVKDAQQVVSHIAQTMTVLDEPEDSSSGYKPSLIVMAVGEKRLSQTPGVNAVTDTEVKVTPAILVIIPEPLEFDYGNRTLQEIATVKAAYAAITKCVQVAIAKCTEADKGVFEEAEKLTTGW